MIYLIEKLWLDPYGSRNPDTASGYAVHGYLTNKAQAERLVKEAKQVKTSAGETLPEFRMSEVQKLSTRKVTKVVLEVSE